MQYHKLLIERPFFFEAGGVLPRLEVAYHTSPRPYSPGEKIVWICHALTANSDAEDWWPQMVGPGKLIDTDRYYVVCVNMLGSPYGSSSPATLNPETGRPYLLDFPRVTVRDIIHATIEVRKALGISKVDLLVGSSIGGFQALEWAVQEPEVIAHAAFMATSARVTPFLTATEESQRMALEADPSFREAASLKGGRGGPSLRPQHRAPFVPQFRMLCRDATGRRPRHAFRRPCLLLPALPGQETLRPLRRLLLLHALL